MTARFIGAALAVLVLSGQLAADTSGNRPDPATVAIVTSSTVEAFEEAVNGIRRGLGPGVNVTVVDLTVKPPPPVKDARVWITLGNNALEYVNRLGKTPVIASMVLRVDLAQSGKVPAGAVALDLHIAEVLNRLAWLFPGKTRVGMIRSTDACCTLSGVLIAQAKAAGFSLTIVECPGPEQLLQSFHSLKGRVDFVWIPPDGSLYNSATVRPLILASLETRLPVAGFSSSFVRTGAVAGVYPDYFDVGTQVGEMARSFLAGVALSNENPRKSRVAFNPRVARLLGLRPIPENQMPAGLVVVQ